MKENTLANRFLLAREFKGLTQKQLADKVGVSQSSIFKIESGQTLKPRDIYDLAKVLSVSVEWLKSGRLEDHQDALLDIDDEVPINNGDIISIPLISDLSAISSEGIIDDNQEQFIQFSKSTLSLFHKCNNVKSLFCLLLNNDSLEPNIPEGSTITVNTRDKNIVDGKIFVIEQSGWKRVKILYRTAPDRVLLKSYNASYPVEEVNLSEITIIGRAVQVMLAI
ncbi:XRE family transcriptional regulator [Thorsellia kenyensis]|uniref:XRE family transcriptional regulator n=1 Tax=Thorsellia kenyensis TaxID=1549888 RepID=A0ABV6CAF9_9GAMM